MNQSKDFPPKKERLTAEQKQNLALKDKLISASDKLKEVIAGLPAKSAERARAEHTLASVKGALKNLGKDGAPAGKYAVSVEGHSGNPEKPYKQNEGIPVNDLIDILKKAAKVNYEKGEEMSDAGFMEESKKLNDLATELEKNSEGYFEAHYTKGHGEGGAWTKEEQNKQDLRTKHEAKLISGDYRATGSEEGDYKLAMETLKNRRELKFIEKSESESELPKAVEADEFATEKKKSPEKPKTVREKIEGKFSATSFDELIAQLTASEYISDISQKKYSKEELVGRINEFKKTGDIIFLPRISNLRVLCVQLFDEEGTDSSKKREQSLEEIRQRKIFLVFLEKAKSGNMESIQALIKFITTPGNLKPEWLTQEQKVWQNQLLVLFESAKGGDAVAISNLTVFISSNMNTWVTKGPEAEKEKSPDEVNGRKMFMIFLERAMVAKDMASISMLITFIQSPLLKEEWLTEKEKSWKIQIIALYEKAQAGDTLAITNLNVYINATINIWNVNPPQTPPQPPQMPPQPANPGNSLPLNDLRDMYLNAKRKRGNVARGWFGRLFGRKLNFKGQDMDFGGKKGAADLEKVRKEYEEQLAIYRSAELAKLPPGATDAEKTQKMIDLLNEEQTNIDTQSVNGIEKNRFEKMKTWWRNLGFAKRGGISAGLLGLSALTAGTSAAAGVVGARALVGGYGMYVGVEAGWERFTKILGHKGLVNDIGKRGALYSTPQSLDLHIASLSDTDVKKEAARLRMLQVEKGIALGNLYQDNNGRIALAIIKRDNELMAAEALKNAGLQNPALGLAGMLSASLALQVDSMNTGVEKEVDRERVKKMLRKSTGIILGGLVGAGTFGLFNPAVSGPGHVGHTAPSPVHPPSPIHPPVPGFTPHPPYPVMSENDNLWNILKSNLDKGGLTKGLDAGRVTHLVDQMKNVYEHMTPAQLKGIGFSSGNINILHAGDSLNLNDTLGNPGALLKGIFNAQNISAHDAAQIIDNDAFLKNWFIAHHQELTGVFDTAKVDAVLHANGR